MQTKNTTHTTSATIARTEIPKNYMKTNATGYCAANYTQTDTYDADLCGPIRATSEEAQADARGRYDGVRYAYTDGYLYVDKPE